MTGCLVNSTSESSLDQDRPELINRIDEIVPFVHLSPDSILAILRGLSARMCAHVQRQYGVELTLDASAEALLAAAGYNPEYGARELRRTLERMVQIPLSHKLLSGELSIHPRWVLTADGDELRFRQA